MKRSQRLAMRWLGMRRDKRNVLHVQPAKMLAARAVVDEHGQSPFPNIVITAELRTPRTDGITGEQVDEIEITLDVLQANHFASQLGSALSASLPARGGPAHNYPWEG